MVALSILSICYFLMVANHASVNLKKTFPTYITKIYLSFGFFTSLAYFAVTVGVLFTNTRQVNSFRHIIIFFVCFFILVTMEPDLIRLRRAISTMTSSGGSGRTTDFASQNQPSRSQPALDVAGPPTPSMRAQSKSRIASATQYQNLTSPKSNRKDQSDSSAVPIEHSTPDADPSEHKEVSFAKASVALPSNAHGQLGSRGNDKDLQESRTETKLRFDSHLEHGIPVQNKKRSVSPNKYQPRKSKAHQLKEKRETKVRELRRKLTKLIWIFPISCISIMIVLMLLAVAQINDTEKYSQGVDDDRNDYNLAIDIFNWIQIIITMYPQYYAYVPMPFMCSLFKG
mmetsp:Transcript_18297/g.44911  ORF Transcript_18297/g.44911 Transcript_18297/m.44911 type:complete len:342 (+) Transcript_18297:302-1327(+)